MTQVQTILHFPDGNSYDVIQEGITLGEAMDLLQKFVAVYEQDNSFKPGSVVMTRSFANPATAGHPAQEPHYVDNPMPDGTKRAPKDWGRVDRMPASGDLVAGDRLECPSDFYKFFPGERIEFWQEGSKFAALTHSLSNDTGIKIFDEIFGDWSPSPNKKVASKSVLIVECAGKTSKGNPYKNLRDVVSPNTPPGNHPVEESYPNDEIPF